MIKIGLLGLGTVGSGVYEIIRDKKDKLKKATGKNIEISKILVRDKNKDRGLNIDQSILTENADEIINDPNIDIIVEVMGGIDKAYSYISKSLKNGKHVVTANKAVISLHIDELHNLAKENNKGLLFEASVGGGIPVIKGLKEAIKINDVDNIKGILNGTTNFILSKMCDENLSFDEALDLAHKLGYAEADPTDDVEGYDAARKISILASLAFNTNASISDVMCRGITSISPLDIKNFKLMGLVAKLIGSATIDGNEFSASVEPILVDESAPFASVKDAFNIVSVEGCTVGELQFYGQGAGKDPTANAVVTDIIDIINESYKEYEYICNDSIKSGGTKLFKGNYYMRVSPNNVNEIPKIVNNLNKSGLEFKVIESDKDLVLITEQISSDQMEAIMNDLDLPQNSYSYLRIESNNISSIHDIDFGNTDSFAM
ncbi:homoserine dehydrogenase Hom [Gottschalkia purinilytica]|uniref:Homoserine dehydrogenase n=1 Tax=Gottschalkia purinilytica TaxID=1503 RepID=A0A0L0W7L7_GOTPU|nr:homoserine dehydrogenase [Gottschalkia purinilytica]KNF07548.1 homoserine dehydrogenase Hom [Gottschalkia purinilytica]